MKAVYLVGPLRKTDPTTFIIVVYGSLRQLVHLIIQRNVQLADLLLQPKMLRYKILLAS